MTEEEKFWNKAEERQMRELESQEREAATPTPTPDAKTSWPKGKASELSPEMQRKLGRDAQGRRKMWNEEGVGAKKPESSDYDKKKDL